MSQALKLVNEIFLGFLKGPCYEHMVANFNEPEDWAGRTCTESRFIASGWQASPSWQRWSFSSGVVH